MKIEPIGERVLIKPNNPQEKTKGGILLSAKGDKQDIGTVISVGRGEGVQEFRKGDVLIYQRYGPAEITIEKEIHILAHLDEILGRETK